MHLKAVKLNPLQPQDSIFQTQRVEKEIFGPN